MYISVDNKKNEYYARKYQMDNNFIWDKISAQKLRTLNDELSKMQESLIKRILSAYHLFSNLEKSLPFLHGFKIIGRISFEKEIVSNLKNLENLTEEQKEEIDKWRKIKKYSREGINAWNLIFDSNIKDFMPLSKLFLSKKLKNSISGFPKNEKAIEFCSYFDTFYFCNVTFSFQDLMECTIKDFTPEISVIINYNACEFHEFSIFNPTFPYDCFMVENVFSNRRNLLNDSFEWNEKNIKKIMKINTCLWKRTEEMKYYIQEINSALNFLSKTDPEFKHYSIDGKIEYHGFQPNDIASIEVQKYLSSNAYFDSYYFRIYEDSQEIIDHKHEDEDYNWNSEIYSNHLSEEQKKIRFHYLMYSLFVEDNIYSFEDLIRMREEDFKVCLEINWSGD